MPEPMHARFFGLFIRLSRRRYGVIYFLLCVFALGGCSATSAVRVVGSAVNLALESAGLKRASDGNTPFNVPVHIAADDSLNTVSRGQPLSLVVRLYLLRSSQTFETMTYEQINAPDEGKSVLGNDLVSIREVTVLPGKSYNLPLTVPGDVKAVGVVGLFYAPADNLWKLAFDASASSGNGIKIGAHACSLSVEEGELTATFATQSASISAKPQCNG